MHRALQPPKHYLYRQYSTMASDVVLALPHKLRVMRMYRTGLKELINWSSTRHEWYPRVRGRPLCMTWVARALQHTARAPAETMPGPTQAAALREEFESSRGIVSARCGALAAAQAAFWRGGQPGVEPVLARPVRAVTPHNKPFHLQTDREEIRKKVEHGEELLARFRHWEPLIRESPLTKQKPATAAAASPQSCTAASLQL